MGPDQPRTTCGSRSDATKDRHRALVSIQEELEAVDWYDQRVEAATDDDLRVILAHNRDEEKEHAAMVLEWLRRHDPVVDDQLRAYLFTSGNILQVEEGANETPDGSLGIGSLRGIAQ
ncbi:MAG: encapsulin-associated ferritin-like protein [Acidimicrobiales bacterium]